MCNCWACGAEIRDDEVIYPLPVYDLKPDERAYTAMGHVFCWDCFSALAGAVNAGIFLIRHPELRINRGEKKKEATNESDS